MHTSLKVALVMGVLSACGGAPPAQPPPTPSPPPPAETAAPPPAPAPSAAWKDMDHGQKLDYMKHTVYPQMKGEFSAFDGKRFGTMTCGTCHKSGSKDGTFKMPTADLPKLNAQGNFQKHREKTPEILEFMLSKVEPDMAKLLGEPPFDAKTHTGFSCFRCHMKE
jgi:hypothetical protein